MGRALVLSLALATSGCGLLYDPCSDLDDRLCADLGADCEVFRGRSSIHESVVPRRRRQAERAQCEMLGADENYRSYTLPYVRHQIAVTRDPSTPAPQLPTPRPVDGLASGFSSWFLCCLPVVVIPFILFVGWRSRQRLAAAPGAPGAPGAHAGASWSGAGGPAAEPPAGPAGGWAHVDSAQAAEARVAAGELEPVELVPATAGGLAVPENMVFLPPAAARRKRELDAQAAGMVQRGEVTGYVAEPEYRGSSFVPVRLRIRLSTRSGDLEEIVEVW
jgi:hypothetical protein